MISIDAVLLGMVVVGFVCAVPIGIAITGLMLWGTRPQKRGRRVSGD